jgi:hypothetical protein
MSTDLLYTIDIPRPAGIHVCVPQLLEDTRFEFDIKDTSLRLTDDQLVRVINRSRNSLFTLLVNLDQTQAFLRMRTTLTTVAGDASVTLPERLYAPVRLSYIDSNSGCARDVKLVRDERVQASVASWQQQRPTYYIAGTEMVINPVPAAAQPLSFVFLQSWVDLVAPPGEPSCWDAQPGWDEWVVLNACMMLSRRSRKTEDVAFFQAGRDDISARWITGIGVEEAEGPVFSVRRTDALGRFDDGDY